MLMLAIITFLTGAALGTRFKFFILVPGGVFVSLAVAVAAAAHAESIGAIMLAIVVANVCLQVGYLAGLFAMHTLKAAAPIAAAMPKGTAPAQRSASSHAN
jgi:hypothetical protein